MIFKLLRIIPVLSVLLFSYSPSDGQDQNFGSFRGDLVVKLRSDGRSLELTRPFAFLDTNQKLWGVPTGTVVDGASIPQAFWSIIKGPLEDKYRDASVIHDYFCEEKTENWEDVHLVFYNGMRANGVGAIKAKLMYAAVYNFGPRWLKIAVGNREPLVSGHPVLLDNVKEAIIKYVTDNNPSIEEIQSVSRKLNEIENADQLEDILYKNAQCTPIIDAEINKTIILCGMSKGSRRQVAFKNIQTLFGDVLALLAPQRTGLIPVVEAYIKDPTEDKWDEVQRWSKQILILIKAAVRSALNAGEDNDPKVVEIANTVFNLLSARATLIDQILGERPKSSEAISKWVEEYKILIGKLSWQVFRLSDALEKQSP